MRHRTALSRESGSVFIVALLALVLLTVIGLSLALVTETEMLLGSNEQVITETFYAGEAGVSVAVGLALSGATTPKCFATTSLEDDGTERQLGVNKLGYSIDTTALYPIAQAPAPYSQANEGQETVWSYFYRGEVRALRGSWPATEAVPREPEEDLDALVAAGDFTLQAEKTIDLSFFASPLSTEISTIDSFDHPDLLGCDEHPDHLVIGAP